VAWFKRIEEGRSHWTKDGLVHDLMLMSGCVWTGERRASPGGMPYTYPRIMNRLETLQTLYPSLSFFVGTFPQVRGQDRTQILWYSDTGLGAEADLPGISASTGREGEK
jgi:hypothetical protein